MTLPPLVLREARADDAEQVLALLDAEDLEAEFVAREFLVAQFLDQVVACARLKALEGGAYELASVAVHPSWRRQGVGERLVRATLARTQGPVFALALAPAFFARIGFEPVGSLPPGLEKKATGLCASRGFVAMEWGPARHAG